MLSTVIIIIAVIYGVCKLRGLSSKKKEKIVKHIGDSANKAASYTKTAAEKIIGKEKK